MHTEPIAALAASGPGPAVLTIALSAYAALILTSIAFAVSESRRGRRGRAIAASSVVAALTVLGVVLAILSSI